jgi:hypothetical protein
MDRFLPSYRIVGAWQMNEAMWKREGEGAHSVREITQSVDKDCSTHNYLSANVQNIGTTRRLPTTLPFSAPSAEVVVECSANTESVVNGRIGIFWNLCGSGNRTRTP